MGAGLVLQHGVPVIVKSDSTSLSRMRAVEIESEEG